MCTKDANVSFLAANQILTFGLKEAAGQNNDPADNCKLWRQKFKVKEIRVEIVP